MPIVDIFTSLSKEDQTKEVKMESREGKMEEGRKTPMVDERRKLMAPDLDSPSPPHSVVPLQSDPG